MGHDIDIRLPDGTDATVSVEAKIHAPEPSVGLGAVIELDAVRLEGKDILGRLPRETLRRIEQRVWEEDQAEAEDYRGLRW